MMVEVTALVVAVVGGLAGIAAIIREARRRRCIREDRENGRKPPV